jgi:hypothetical protein
MRSSHWFAYAAGIAIMIASSARPAQAQVVTFSNINDAVGGRFFDAATSAPDPLNPNRLIIGFDSGTDPATWRATDFRASTAAFSYTTAMDTISLRIEAPSGFYISKITYSQSGSGSAYRTGKASGAANWVVADYAANLGTFSTNPTTSQTVDLTGLNLTVVPVSITNALFAYATPTSGSATVSITGAEVVVEVTPLTP